MFGDGSSRRDYTYISDIIHGVMQAINHCSGYHIYNLGESRTIKLQDLIKVLENQLNKTAIINPLPNQPGDVPITYADISLARQELEYNPQVGIEDGIEKFIEWFLEIYE